MVQLMLSLPRDQIMEYTSYHTDNPRGETGGYQLISFFGGGYGKATYYSFLASNMYELLLIYQHDLYLT